MGERDVFRGVFATGACVAALLAVPAIASASTTYYAAPNTTGTGTECTQAAPCRMSVALTEAQNGDSVALESGVYNLFVEVTIEKAIVFGAAPGATAEIVGLNEISALKVAPGVKATLHDLTVSGEGGLVVGTEAVAERLYVEYTNKEGSACFLEDGALLRDSVCLAASQAIESSADAVLATPGPSSSTGPKRTVEIRNVTAIAQTASGHGLHAHGAFNSLLPVDAANVIARAAHASDVAATSLAEPLAEAHVQIVDSNFETVTQSPSKLSVTSPTTAGNQTAPPVFVDAAEGNFAEGAGSPTIDGGLSDSLIGALDAAGAPRSQPGCFGGAAIPDIGAYESSAMGPCPPPPPPPPKPPEPPKPQFRVLSVSLDRQHGGAQLEVEVPSAGTLSLTGPGLRLVRRRADAGGEHITLPVKPWAITLVRLKKRGHTKVHLKLTFQASGNPPRTISRPLVLRKAGHRRAHRRHHR